MQANPARRCNVLRLGLVPYTEAWKLQRELVGRCRVTGEQQLLLLEHPPTYTMGPRAKAEHIVVSYASLERLGATVQEVDRGGDVTFHGPGQLVAYPIINLSNWHQGASWYVRQLESVLIDTLARLGVDGRRNAGQPGVWVGTKKIASVGVRVSRGITSHGVALNVGTDLSFFSYIVPCGLPGVEMTSLGELLPSVPSMSSVEDAFERSFERVFELATERESIEPLREEVAVR